MTETGEVVVAANAIRETVAEFFGPMPVGVAVSREGRIFVSFPRWGEPVDHAVAELVDGQTFPYPDQTINRPTPEDPSASLMSVQSVVVDAADRLWILDTGQGALGPAAFGGAETGRRGSAGEPGGGADPAARAGRSAEHVSERRAL